MRTIRTKLITLLLCFGLLCPIVTVRAATTRHAYTVAEAEDLCGGIVVYKASLYGVNTAQELIDRGLVAEAGTTGEYYAITLSQSGAYDLSRYEQALLDYLDTHEVYSATTREKYALTLIACGSSDGYIQRVCDEDIGGLGLMSLVFGLHLLNNGCSSALYDTGALIDTILSYQLSDGGWAVIGGKGDADVTAMTVQALAPYYGVYSSVTAAIDSALDLLSQMQLDSGGYRSMGAENCESAAQVLCALSALGIDAQEDGRFIKNGASVLDAMLGYRRADGSFSHTGSGMNENATIQAFYSLRAYLRMRYGQSPFYILDNQNSVQPEATEKKGEASTPNKSPQKDQHGNIDAPQVSGDSHDSADKADPDTQIIYIGGRAYVSATDSKGEEVTVAASETRAQAAPTAAPTIHGELIVPSYNTKFQPDGTTVRSTADEATTQKGGYKPYAILAVMLSAGGVALVLFLLKKRGFKHYLPVILIAAGLIVLILLTNFESAESYRAAEEKNEAAGTVTMTIRCDTLADEDDRAFYIPDDGVILPETTFSIGEGDTAYDVLLDASKTYDIHIDNRGGEGSAYIAGIGYLYEYEYGSLSGWMYRVNGEFPETGCQSCVLCDGDRIEWLYTKDIGHDL